MPVVRHALRERSFLAHLIRETFRPPFAQCCSKMMMGLWAALWQRQLQSSPFRFRSPFSSDPLQFSWVWTGASEARAWRVVRCVLCVREGCAFLQTHSLIKIDYHNLTIDWPHTRTMTTPRPPTIWLLTVLTRDVSVLYLTPFPASPITHPTIN